MADTQITIIGNIVADPELRFVPSGAPVANFRVASTPRRFNSQTGQWEDGEALFLSCNVWRQAAENAAESLSKGMRVIVTGKLRQRSFQTREGENRTAFEIDVDEVGPSLRYATAQVSRNPREGGQSGGNFNRGPQQQSGQPPQQQQSGGNFGGGGWNNEPQGGFGSNSAPQNDPWSSAPRAGEFDDTNDDPPF